jgi:hypothetical protein
MKGLDLHFRIRTQINIQLQVGVWDPMINQQKEQTSTQISNQIFNQVYVQNFDRIKSQIWIQIQEIRNRKV